MTATTTAPAPTAPPVRYAHSPTTRWRFAARFARREVQRRPGRTLLVVVLVAIPVFAMSVITVLVRTENQPNRAVGRQFGTADLAVAGLPAGSMPARPPGGWPPGTKIVTGRTDFSVGLLRGATARLAEVRDIDLTNVVTRGTVLLRSGRFPTRAGETLLSPELERAFNVTVGDDVTFDAPAWKEKIVGIGVDARDWRNRLMVVRGDELAARPQAVRGVLVDVPASAQDLLARPPSGFFSVAELRAGNNSSKAVNWILVAGAVALAIVGVVIAGAFAVGARRQLVTLGQLSANGADERLLRRTLALQGALCGLLGSVVGMLGGAVLVVALHDRINSLLRHDTGAFVWTSRDLVLIATTGLVTATIAAYIPARSAARIPVLTALAGRRPLGRVPRALVPLGVMLFGLGVLLLALVTASRNGSSTAMALTAILGSLLALAGACCFSPITISALGGFATRTRGAVRVGVRSLVRTRTRSAAVVMGLLAINAGTVAIATAVGSVRRTVEFGVTARLPQDVVYIGSFQDLVIGSDTFVPQTRPTSRPGERVQRVPAKPPKVATPQPSATTLPADTEQRLRAVLPGARWYRQRAVIGRPGPQDQEFAVNIATVVDAPALHLLNLDAKDRQLLQRVGVGVPAYVVERGDEPLPAETRVTLNDGTYTRTVDAAVLKSAGASIAVTKFVITPARARQLGLHVSDLGWIVQTPKPLTESQRASLDAISALPTPSGFGGLAIDWGRPETNITVGLVMELVMVVATIAALLVLAMMLALSAAESRDERDVLVSLGARPRTLKGVAATKAGVLAFVSALIAVPAGYIPLLVIEHRVSVPIPWSTVLQLLLLAPLVAAVVAFVGSGIAQRVRPTRASTFAVD